MSRRKTLSDLGVAALKPRATRYAFPDPELAGHFIRVTPHGAKSYCAVSRDPTTGKQVWATIGPCDRFKIEDARDMARKAIKRVREGQAPFEAPKTTPESFEAVAALYMRRRAKELRSKGEIERIIKTYITPEWKGRAFTAIRRGDVVALLDKVEDANGAMQADAVLAVVRQIANWYAIRHEDYAPPIAKGMRRTNPRARQRARILDDDEIRAVWRHAEGRGAFGAFVRLLLLTAQRRAKVAAMKWDDLVDGEWRIATEAKEKGTGGALILPDSAKGLIATMPKIGDNPYVFAGRGDTHLRGFSKAKADFDAGLPTMPPWVLHDLRRTAKSLMARAGARPDISERVLGHVISGVEGVYDRHSYRDEKADALKRLAGLIDLILNPPVTKVAIISAVS